MNGDRRQLERQSPDDADLDAVIDAVAREMTGAEPSGALRARVLDEIARSQRQPLALPRWAWAGAAAALVVAAATTVWLARPSLQPAGERGATVAQRLPASEPDPQRGPAQAAPAASSPSVPAQPARRTSVPPAARDLDETPPGSHQLPALAEIEPLRFTSVEPAALRVESLEIASLPPLPSIEIPSLESGSRDMQSADPKKENRP